METICRAFDRGVPGGQDGWFSMAAGALLHPQCGRYELGLDVVDAVQRVRQGKPQSVLSAIHMVRSRHAIVWIEWVTPDSEYPTVRVGWLVVETPTTTTVGIRFGLMPDGDLIIWDIASIIPVMRGRVAPIVISDNERPWLENQQTTLLRILTPERMREKSGSMANQVGRYVPSLSLEDIKAQFLLMGGYPGTDAGLLQDRQMTSSGAIDWRATAMDRSAQGNRSGTELAATLLLLNTRNAVSIGEEPDYSKLEKQRARRGKRPLARLRPVIMDITRRLRAARRAGLHVTHEELRSALVSGHFKARAPGSKGGGGGVFWWSPHVRSGRGERGTLPVKGRDYEAR
ncbi:MAG: hypothetical protein M3Y22_17690 [Pseudomonadota bacterium]|nr:hypothetical protein [Pseudomonadota bacterium]